MAKRVIWSEDAFRDKEQIYSYWNNRNKSNLYSQKLKGLQNEPSLDFSLIYITYSEFEPLA
jgi:hypothetical protein